MNSGSNLDELFKDLFKVNQYGTGGKPFLTGRAPEPLIRALQQRAEEETAAQGVRVSRFQVLMRAALNGDPRLRRLTERNMDGRG